MIVAVSDHDHWVAYGLILPTEVGRSAWPSRPSRPLRLAHATDWGQILRIQSEYLRVSVQRGAQLTQRYLEASQIGTGMAAANITRDQAETAA